MKKRNFLKMAKAGAQIADDNKAKDIVILNVRRISSVVDYFLLITVDSTPQRNAVINTIEKEFKDKIVINPIHRDGDKSPSWSVLDYGGLIIHVMSQETRKLYALERIWKEVKNSKQDARSSK